MSTLYELTADLIALLDMADDPDVEEDIWKDTFEGVQGEFEIKAEGYAKVMKEIDSQVASLDAEIKRLKARKETMEHSSTRIKKALEEAMRAIDKPKFKTDLFSFNIQKNPASLQIRSDVDIYSIPADFIKFAEPEIDKAKVKDAIKSGAEFDWAELVQTESLRIR